MTSVDLAFAGVAEAAEADAVRYWRLWDQSEWTESPGGSFQSGDGLFFDENANLTYELLRGRLDDFLDAKAVVFWGDFLHMAVYQRQAVDVLTHRMDAYRDPDEAAKVVAKHLLLRGQSKDTLDRVLSYGTTLSFNTTSDCASEYGQDLEGFLTGVRRVWHRDPYSALVAQTARRPRQDTCKGTDAALLLGEESPRPRKEGIVGVFLGRSAFQPEPLGRFGAALVRRLGLQPEWIAWGREPGLWPMERRRRLRLAWPGLEHHTFNPTLAQRLGTYTAAVRNTPGARSEVMAPQALFDHIARATLVVTDTYHLAVNAWRLGVPAICVVDNPALGWNVNSGDHAARRDKRVDFYSQIDALGLIVDASELRFSPARAVERLAAFLEDPGMLDVVRARLSAQKSHAKSMVVGALKDLLDDRSPDLV